MEVLGEVRGQDLKDSWAGREPSGSQLQLIPRAKGWSGGPGPGLQATGSDPRPSLGPIPHQKEEGAVESIVGGVGLWGRVTGPLPR